MVWHLHIPCSVCQESSRIYKLSIFHERFKRAYFFPALIVTLSRAGRRPFSLAPSLSCIAYSLRSINPTKSRLDLNAGCFPRTFSPNPDIVLCPLWGNCLFSSYCSTTREKFTRKPVGQRYQKKEISAICAELYLSSFGETKRNNNFYVITSQFVGLRTIEFALGLINCTPRCFTINASTRDAVCLSVCR